MGGDEAARVNIAWPDALLPSPTRPPASGMHGPLQPCCHHSPAVHSVIACICARFVLHSINLEVGAGNAAAHPAQGAAHLGVAAVLRKAVARGLVE